jgi:hypothetical protein
MQAPETTDVVQPIGNRMRGACVVSGCTCKDSRILSFRRVAFFAAVARRSGQTADRVVAVESDWRIPTAEVGATVQL